MMLDNERELLERLKQDDIEAFNTLYFMYSSRLYARLLKLLKNSEHVEEVLQDVFLRLWNKRKEIDSDRNFHAFIFRIADNLAIDLFRKISRDKVLQLELWAAAVSYYFHSEEKLLNKERMSILREAMETLPPKRKEIFILCKIEDRSYKEVAEILGVSVSTVSNQLVRAVKDVKEHILKNYEKDYLLGFFFVFFLSN